MKKILIIFFLIIFLSGISGSFFGSSCIKSSNLEDSARFFRCNLAINLGFLPRIIGTDETEFSSIYFERGLVGARLGKLENSKKDFITSINLLGSEEPYNRKTIYKYNFKKKLIARANKFPKGSKENIAWLAAADHLGIQNVR